MAVNSFSPFMSPSSGMGYSGADPVRLPYQQPSGGSGMGMPNFSPVQLPNQPASPPPMSVRNAQMMARYLPGSGTGVDPNFSPTTTAQRGGYQNMVPQRLRGLFQQFQGANPGMTNYDQYRQSTGYASRAPVNPSPIATAMQGQMNSMGTPPAQPQATGAPAAAGAPVVNALMRNRTTPNNTY